MNSKNQGTTITNKGTFRLLRKAAVPQYLATGVLVFAVDYCAFFVCYQLLGLQLAVSTAIAFLIGLATSFILSRTWVFAAQVKGERLRKSAVRYVIFLVATYALIYLFLKFLQQWFLISPYVGKFGVSFFLTFWNYFGYKFWVFRAARQAF